MKMHVRSSELNSQGKPELALMNSWRFTAYMLKREKFEVNMVMYLPVVHFFGWFILDNEVMKAFHLKNKFSYCNIIVIIIAS